MDNKIWYSYLLYKIDMYNYKVHSINIVVHFLKYKIFKYYTQDGKDVVEKNINAEK